MGVRLERVHCIVKHTTENKIFLPRDLKAEQNCISISNLKRKKKVLLSEICSNVEQRFVWIDVQLHCRQYNSYTDK